MKKTVIFIKVVLLLLIIFLLSAKDIFAQENFENKVELTGVVMSADSLMFLPYVNVFVKNKNKGVRGSSKGVFSIIVDKGDLIEFSYLGFRPKFFKVPDSMHEKRYSIIQLMVQDTFYLPTTIIKPNLSRQEFEYAFVNWDIEPDKLELARQNTSPGKMLLLRELIAKDGRENQHVYQNNQIKRSYWTGGQPPQRIFDPLAWGEFLQAWKRGDFKKK
ncbi:MAG: carboxypeptidase-like regulatory domain-containing protein [Chitinophagaceae bacterium]|nr:carboxypeptidase-like regulatory domain-containing protein [Chitinophagaceae bacterium]